MTDEAWAWFLKLNHPISILIVFTTLFVLFMFGRGKPNRLGAASLVSYALLGSAAGLIVAGFLLVVFSSSLFGVLLLVVWWPIAISVGATIGGIFWWIRDVKPNSNTSQPPPAAAE